MVLRTFTNTGLKLSLKSEDKMWKYIYLCSLGISMFFFSSCQTEEKWETFKPYRFNVEGIFLIPVQDEYPKSSGFYWMGEVPNRGTSFTIIPQEPRYGGHALPFPTLYVDGVLVDIVPVEDAVIEEGDDYAIVAEGEWGLMKWNPDVSSDRFIFDIYENEEDNPHIFEISLTGIYCYSTITLTQPGKAGEQ